MERRLGTASATLELMIFIYGNRICFIYNIEEKIFKIVNIITYGRRIYIIQNIKETKDSLRKPYNSRGIKHFQLSYKVCMVQRELKLF